MPRLITEAEADAETGTNTKVFQKPEESQEAGIVETQNAREAGHSGIQFV